MLLVRDVLCGWAGCGLAVTGAFALSGLRSAEPVTHRERVAAEILHDPDLDEDDEDVGALLELLDDIHSINEPHELVVLG